MTPEKFNETMFAFTANNISVAGANIAIEAVSRISAKELLAFVEHVRSDDNAADDVTDRLDRGPTSTSFNRANPRLSFIEFMKHARELDTSSSDALRASIVTLMASEEIEWKADAARFADKLMFGMLLAVREVVKLKDTATAAEAPPTAPLGMIAFAPQRLDAVPNEPNTGIEDELYDTIKKHFDGDKGSVGLSDNAVKLLQAMTKKGYYSETFDEPKKDAKLYRGLSVKATTLANLLECSPEEIEEYGEEDINAVLNPIEGRIGSSWSHRHETAAGFAKPTISSKQLTEEAGQWYKIILTALSDDNPDKFVEGFYNLKHIDEYRDEYEVIGIGPIRVNSINWELHKPRPDSSVPW